MTTTIDTDALTERIAGTLWGHHGADGMRSILRPDCYVLAAAVLPIVEDAARAAKAEALREAAGDIVWSAETLPHMTPHDAARGLVRRADRIETGGSDEHR